MGCVLYGGFLQKIDMLLKKKTQHMTYITCQKKIQKRMTMQFAVKINLTILERKKMTHGIGV